MIPFLVMRQRILRLAVVGSTIIAVLLVSLWIRSFFARDRVAFPVGSRYFVISTFAHHVYFENDDGGQGMQASAQFGLTQYPARTNYLEVRFIPQTQRPWALAIPFWLPLVFFLALPGWAIGKRIRRMSRRSHGLCPNCGYDVRATPDRCPECGLALL